MRFPYKVQQLFQMNFSITQLGNPTLCVKSHLVTQLIDRRCSNMEWAEPKYYFLRKNQQLKSKFRNILLADYTNACNS